LKLPVLVAEIQSGFSKYYLMMTMTKKSGGFWNYDWWWLHLLLNLVILNTLQQWICCWLGDLEHSLVMNLVVEFWWSCKLSGDEAVVNDGDLEERFSVDESGAKSNVESGDFENSLVMTLKTLVMNLVLNLATLKLSVVMNLIPTFCPDRQCPEMQNAKELFKNVSGSGSST
jgi:hypothetical protein